MLKITVEPFCEHDDDATFIHFIAEERDVGTLLHAYMTTAESIRSFLVSSDTLDGECKRSFYFTRADIATPAPDSFDEGVDHLFHGNADSES